MKTIANHFATFSTPKPITPKWENVRRNVASKAGRHAIIAGGAI
jgi:hypothetical protein